MTDLKRLDFMMLMVKANWDTFNRSHIAWNSHPQMMQGGKVLMKTRKPLQWKFLFLNLQENLDYLYLKINKQWIENNQFGKGKTLQISIKVTDICLSTHQFCYQC